MFRVVLPRPTDQEKENVLRDFFCQFGVAAAIQNVPVDRLLVAIDAALKAAEAGNIQALKFLAEYIKGPPVAAEVLERIETLEQALAERGEP